MYQGDGMHAGVCQKDGIYGGVWRGDGMFCILIHMCSKMVRYVCYNVSWRNDMCAGICQGMVCTVCL